MNKYYNVVTLENLKKLADCFSDGDEFETFMSHVADLSNEMYFNFLLLPRVDTNSGVTVAMKQVFAIALFVREHMELINELVRAVECQKMTKEQVDELEGRESND